MGVRVLLTPEAGGNALGDTPVFWEANSCGGASPELSFWQLLGPSLWAKGLLGAGVEVSVAGGRRPSLRLSGGAMRKGSVSPGA